MNHNIHNFFQRLSVELAAFLERELPPLFDDWWNKAVVNTLSFQQKKRLAERNITSLGGLDIAGLLRVLDQNWYQISNSLNLTSEARHFVKEMQTVRNRWAHADSKGVSVDDTYRDVDTLQRFAVVIGTEETLIRDLQETKTSLISKNAPPQPDGDAEKPSQSPERKKNEAEFELGQIVFIKSNPSNRGAVVAVLPGKPENRFKVFIDGITQTLYASQIQSEDQGEVRKKILTCDQFHAYLTAIQIKYPGLSTLYSLNAARVDFIPYQFRPVLRFIRSDRPRLLIADGVGVGKTIEGGLILRELQARREINSVLIVCPRPLVTEEKWKKEMKRFEERFTHLDGATLRYCINEMALDGVWPEQHQKVIVPYSLFDETLLYGSASGGKRKRKKGLLDIDPPPRFDLVIVDEAHHIRNQDTFSHKAVKFFCDHAEAVVFLTATPIQLGNKDLFVLLNVLRPDLIIDQESFAHMAEPNPFINRAVSAIRSQESAWQSIAIEALDQAASTPWGQSILKHSPDYGRIRTALLRDGITHEERIKIISDTEGMHTFAGIINRTRRCDIGDFTIRKPETVVIPFTPAQQQLHDELLIIQAEIFSQIHDGINVKFMMTTIRRQAASCLFGLSPFLEDILNRHLDELSWEEADETGIPEDEAIIPIQAHIERLLKTTRSLEAKDPKLEALRNIIRDKQRLPNNKIMLFSCFRHTLSYLFEHLTRDGFRVGLVHGGTPDVERVALRVRFEKTKEDEDCIDLLLFSEIGCEGLDYQFCDCIVNYDLPWNPMRVEQRIGRIDRNGQKSESVAIINLITSGTVDADIYERCLVRIGVFNNALGGSEEILGEITREIKNIAENYELNEDERKGQLKQLADNKIRLIQEQEELEQKQAELFGIRLPQEQMNQEIADAASFWLSPLSLRRVVTFYLQQVCGKDQEFILGEKPLKTLRLAQEARSRLLKDFHQIPRQKSSVYREWETWLKGGSQHLSITFESNCAMQNPEADFIMPLHPLVKQAARFFDLKKKVITNLSVVSNEIVAGRYEFAIYQWRFYGIKEDLVLKPIGSNLVVTEQLGRLLEIAVDSPDLMSDDLDNSVWDDLDTQHYSLWYEARATHRQKTQKLAEYRKESLTTSHRARIALLEEQLNQATNEKIQKMRRSQIATAEADYARRIQELDIALEKADIVADPVAYGVIMINPGRQE
ncbi:DEAD/DEAH box helicase [Desulfobacter latus]|uniref:DEAD/DEAH box helicase family protein n=1 Tax=Desulfobacter latus TaxID=2292 RepID=A0A850TDW3_9BACT|nr:Swt1 family HEPN domain-containing protein [Desulfobacter latus]NWH05626.1 DEAD/DEAH box helicase family protein [Desulfobacter latus]